MRSARAGATWRVAVLITSSALVVSSLGLTAGATAIEPRSASPGATDLAIIGLVSVAQPTVLAVAADDSVYVGTGIDGWIAEFNGRNPQAVATMFTIDDSEAGGLAVRDDSLYVTQPDNNFLKIVHRSTRSVVRVLETGSVPRGIALKDDTIWVANEGVGSAEPNFEQLLPALSVYRDDTPVSTALARRAPLALAATDDTLFIASQAYVSSGYLRISDDSWIGTAGSGTLDNARDVATTADDTVLWIGGTAARYDLLTFTPAASPTVPSRLVFLGEQLEALAVDDTGGWAYVARATKGATMHALIGVALNSDDTVEVALPGNPLDVAVSRSGLAYVSLMGLSRVAVVGPVQSTLVTTSGSVGSAATIDLAAMSNTGTVMGDVTVDDSTVVAVSFAGTDASFALSNNVVTATVPTGAVTGPVTVTYRGGRTVTAGNFTVGGGPGPTPDPTSPPAPGPPAAPTQVSASPGDRTILVTWSSSPGEAQQFLAVASPGGRSCLTSTNSCIISDLTNGAAYTVTVRALNAGGWSPASEPSAPVTPRPGAAPQPQEQTLPGPLRPGESLTLVDGEQVPAAVRPGSGDQGLDIEGDGWTMGLQGLGPDLAPLNLGPDGVLELEAELDVATNGTGFRPGTSVGIYLDPPVVQTARSAGGVLVGTVRTDASGSFRGQVRLPDGVEPGDHVLQAVGFTPELGTRALNLGIRVRAWAQWKAGPRVPDRRADRVRATGRTGGIEPGTVLVPMVRVGGRAEATGSGVVVVTSDGSFTWTRRVRPGRTIQAYVMSGDLRSNVISWKR